MQIVFHRLYYNFDLEIVVGSIIVTVAKKSFPGNTCIARVC